MRRTRGCWGLLAVALLVTGCASLSPPSALGSSPLSLPEAKEGQRLHRRQRHGEGVRHGRSRSAAGTFGRSRPRGDQEPERQSVARTRQAVLKAVDEVKGTTGGVSRVLSQLAARPRGLGNRGLSGRDSAFTRYRDYGSDQLPWLHGALGGATTLADAAQGVADPDMELGLLRMTGPRLQAAMFGAMLLAAWGDFLQLADAVLRECPAYSEEQLFMDMHRVQKLMEPSLVALASGEPEQVEAAATAMPELMGQLTREFGAIRDGARRAMERSSQLIAAAQLVEVLTLGSALRMSLPRLGPAAPATLGVGLVMGSNGMLVGSRLVVSAEWMERMRQLVRAGVISVPAVSAAVRIHAGQVMMAQAHQELPQGVREALGEGPEVRGMHVTGKAGAGMAERPKHHVLPEEHREWFEQRGFKGDLDIDKFCVELEQAHHQAIHGGGHWRLGRTWPGEWNQMIMDVLQRAEYRAGRRLTRDAILKLVAREMKRYKIPMNFTPGRRR